MSGPTQPWDQSGDPRESTVDLPRLDLAELADYFRGAAGPPEPAGRLDPLPEPDRLRSSAQDPEPGRLPPRHRPDASSTPGRRPETAGFLHPYAEPDVPSRQRVEPGRAHSAESPRPRERPGASEPPRLPAAAAAGPAPSSSHAPPGPRARPTTPPPVSLGEPIDPAAALSANRSRPGADIAAPTAARVSAPIASDVLAANVAPAASTEAGPDDISPDAQPTTSVQQGAIHPAQPAPEPGTTSRAAPPPTPHARDMLRPEPGDSGRAAPLSRPSRVRAGSLADLRSRLARLPDGHPSSFYDDGGQVRPLPVRLKQLELGLPAPGREPAEQLPA